MNNKRADIAQIRKYHNGELDAQAMHQLEREAQDDPFLMDALDGYESTPTDQQVNIDDLQERLRQRVAEKETRVIPMWYWGVAASILIVAGIGTFWYKTNVNESPALTAQADKTFVEPKDTVASVKKPDAAALITTPQPGDLAFDAKKPKPSFRGNALKKEPPVFEKEEVVSTPEAAAPIVPSDIIAASPVKTVAKKAKTDSTADLSDMIMAGMASEKLAIDTGKKYQVALNGRVKGVQTSPNYNAPKQPMMVQGVVIGRDDGLPIPGVNIRVLGSTAGTVTDVNGRFALSAAKNKTVAVGVIGYQSAQINLKGKDSVRIDLQPSSQSLSEVVVTNSSNIDRDIPQYDARPQKGWSDFKKYLKENSSITDGKEGDVKLQFTVSQYGQINDIKVTKSLDTVADARAIELIKNGPPWEGNTNRKPEIVKVKVVFKKGK